MGTVSLSLGAKGFVELWTPQCSLLKIFEGVKLFRRNILSQQERLERLPHGVTCGTISTSSAAFSVQVEEGVYRTYYGVVEVTTQDYMVIAHGGDSGGPVFTYPTWNTSMQTFDASAAGVTVAGNDRYRRPCITNQDSGCNLIYMPIDRINDHGPYNVVPTAGVIAP